MANKKKEKKIGGGLVETPVDPRDFSYSTVFGAPALEDLPDGDFYVGEPLVIKDQGASDLCTAYALTAVSEDQELIELAVEYTFFKTKELMKGDPMSWGADLRSACKSAVKFGFLEEQYNPFAGEEFDRSRVVDPKEWEEDHNMLAWDHAKISFFVVDGPRDTFDNIRAALYNHRSEARSVFTGCLWRRSWTSAEKGIIKAELTPFDVQPGNFFGHAFKIFGQKLIDGELYLVAQLSNGKDIGDKGIFYFPREVVNRDFTYTSFTFQDMPKDKADYHNYYKVRVDENWISKFVKVIGRILLDLLNLKK